MSLILLLDLDNTLLKNDVSVFADVYLKALGDHIDQSTSGQIRQHILLATQAMTAKDTPALTLEQVFDRSFYPGIGINKVDVWDSMQIFYDQVFPTLKSVTAARPAAKRLVEYGFEKKYKVVVATNPLFPRIATLQRLDWADLPISSYPFDLISSYESFHFAKPQPAYYTEILAQLGWLPLPAVMIGNSLEDDVGPASTLGIPVFWLKEDHESLPEGVHPLSAAGTIEQALPWLENLSKESIRQPFESPEALLALLAATPAALDTFSRELKDQNWSQQPQTDEWSFAEIMCHLRDVDSEVYLPRFHIITSQQNPFLPGVDTDRWAEERAYHLQDGKTALEKFTAARTQLLGMLKTIQLDEWKRTARHAVFGPTTLHELVCFIATHDRNHIQQAIRALKPSQ